MKKVYKHGDFVIVLKDDGAMVIDTKSKKWTFKGDFGKVVKEFKEKIDDSIDPSRMKFRWLNQLNFNNGKKKKKKKRRWEEWEF